MHHRIAGKKPYCIFYTTQGRNAILKAVYACIKNGAAISAPAPALACGSTLRHSGTGGNAAPRLHSHTVKTAHRQKNNGATAMKAAQHTLFLLSLILTAVLAAGCAHNPDRADQQTVKVSGQVDVSTEYRDN